MDTAAEARRFVDACLYAPLGTRSFGAARAAALHGPDYVTDSAGFVLKLAMVETRTALANLHEILAVPHLDGMYVGVADLSLSLGYAASQAMEDAEVAQAVAAIADAARRAGKVAGIHCGSPGAAGRMMNQGFGLATLMTDLRLYADAMRAAAAEARAEAARPA